MIKLVTLPLESKRKFLSGGKVHFPFPKCCPFCKGPAKRCLVCWGFYPLKAKRCLDGLTPGAILYVQRFFCKHSGKTFSRLPDILHPRKWHTQNLVGAVLDSLLAGGNGLCATANEFSLHYQTLQWWLKNLAGKRQAKAACFSGAGALDAVFKSPRRTWCVQLWARLQEVYGRGAELLLIVATRAILAVTPAGLY